MNRHAMPSLRTVALALSLFASLALAACGPGNGSAPTEQPPLAGSSIGGPFTLTDQFGKTVKWSDFDGNWRIVYFGYAYCPDVCPLDVQHMAQGYNAFAKDEPKLAAETKMIFITIDPERDTPQVVGEFARNFSDKLIGLTGTPQQVAQAAKAFSVYYAKGKTSPGGYLMDHSRGAYLMGRKGEPIALVPVDQGKDAVAAELRKWIR